VATPAVARRTPEPPALPLPADIVRFYPNPMDLVRAYLDSDFAKELAAEHERLARLLIQEGPPDVTDAESYGRVGERLVEVARHRKNIEAFFQPVTQLFDRFHQKIVDRRNDVLGILTTFETTAKANRLALEQQDARDRREREQREAEEARRIEQDRMVREAEHIQATEPALADVILEEAAVVPYQPFSMASSLPRTKGIGKTRENWKWSPVLGDTPEGRVRAERMVPREFMELSDRKLTAHAKAHKGAAKVPGIRFYDAGSVPVR
jgi:hypothetical protein